MGKQWGHGREEEGRREEEWVQLEGDPQAASTIPLCPILLAPMLAIVLPHWPHHLTTTPLPVPCLSSMSALLPFLPRRAATSLTGSDATRRFLVWHILNIQLTFHALLSTLHL